MVISKQTILFDWRENFALVSILHFICNKDNTCRKFPTLGTRHYLNRKSNILGFKHLTCNLEKFEMIAWPKQKQTLE